MSNYLLSIPKTENITAGTIHDSKTKLKVKAIDLLKSTFIPSKGEVSYFVTAGKKMLAFETDGYDKQKKVLVLQMVAWYCMYSGLLEAQIHSSLPI
jgi:hypothetical protein